MATRITVQLESLDRPQFYREGTSQASTKKANELLEENHKRHHIFFNEDGFHNHIAHHLLTMWSLNAAPEDLQRGYDSNRSYQRPARKPNPTITQDLHDPHKFISYLGPEKHYNDFLQFFREEIAKKGWQDVVQEYVFAGDERAETMLVRMFAGLLHPIIHLGFGMEFQQPLIIAEALAQAACHDDWIGEILLPAERAAQQNGNDKKTIVELLDELRASKEIRDAPRWSDPNKIRNGLLARSLTPLLTILSQISIPPTTSSLALKTAEMTSTTLLFTAAAQRPPHKTHKFDFYFLHSANSSLFFSTFAAQPWLSLSNKCRLLEWKIRFDLVMYASRKSPDLHVRDVKEYIPSHPSSWNGVFDRACKFDDDGHTVKLIRAVANAEEVCRPFEGEKGFVLEGEDWLKIGHMVMDSVEMARDGGGGETWLRSVGFDEAWEGVPGRDREGARL